MLYFISRDKRWHVPKSLQAIDSYRLKRNYCWAGSQAWFQNAIYPFGKKKYSKQLFIFSKFLLVSKNVSKWKNKTPSHELMLLKSSSWIYYFAFLVFHVVAKRWVFLPLADNWLYVRATVTHQNFPAAITDSSEAALLWYIFILGLFHQAGPLSYDIFLKGSPSGWSHRGFWYHKVFQTSATVNVLVSVPLNQRARASFLSRQLALTSITEKSISTGHKQRAVSTPTDTENKPECNASARHAECFLIYVM